MVKAIFIDWCPKDALDGMVQLDPWEELAYRRVLDFIYVTGNNLKDDDRKLGWMTKTGRRWPRIKQTLLAEGKIYIKAGLICNEKCDDKLAQLDKKIAQKRMAGEVSAAQRKSLVNNPRPATAVGTGETTDVPTADPTASQRTHLPTYPLKEKPSGKRNGVSQDDDALAIPPSLDRLKDEFEKFWEAVPNKKVKGHARTAYRAARRKTNAEALLAGIKVYAESVAGKEARFIAHPATWLRGERWLDEQGGTSAANATGEHTDDQGVRRSDFTGSPMEGP